MNAQTLPRPSQARVWILAIRPATLSAAVGPVAVGMGAASHHGDVSLSNGLLALLAAAFIQIAVNLHNDLSDFQRGADTPERLGEARAAQQGWLSIGELKRAVGLTLALAGVVALLLALRCGWPVIAIAVASVGGALGYTGGPFPLAYNGLGDLFVFVFFGLVAVCGTAFVASGSVPAIAWQAAVPVGLLATAILVVNNLRDRFTDAKAGKRTLAVRFGARFTRLQYAALVTTPYVISAAFIGLGQWPVACAAVALSLPLAWAAVGAIYREDGAALNPWLGNTAKLGLVFSLLLGGGLAL